MTGTNRNRWLEAACSKQSNALSQGNAFHVPLRRLAQAALLNSVFLILGMTQSLAADPADSVQGVTPLPSRLIQGKVTAIVDGDTLYLDTGGAAYVVDLAGIDAPEKGQAFGDVAAQVLHHKVLLRQIQLLVLAAPTPNPVVIPITPVPVESAQSDRPMRQRVCGIIYSEGCVNSQLVREGLAWHDSRECPSNSLAQAQESARSGHRGLWQSDREPIAPWQWRANRSTLAAPSDAATDQDPEVKDLSRFFEAKAPPAVVEATSRMREALPVAPDPSASSVVPAGAYWLTASSGIRHNSKCRFYGKSKGRACRADEGRPCQKCGG